MASGGVRGGIARPRTQRADKAASVRPGSVTRIANCRAARPRLPQHHRQLMIAAIGQHQPVQHGDRDPSVHLAQQTDEGISNSDSEFKCCNFNNLPMD